MNLFNCKRSTGEPKCFACTSPHPLSITVGDIICEKGRAVGVTVVKGDEKHSIRAKTIISAAGLYNTMKMLPPEMNDKLC